MERHDLQLVRRVLGVLHDVDELDFNHPDIKTVQENTVFDGSTVLVYDLRKKPSVQLPSIAAHVSNLVEQHLSATDSTDPWGFIDENLVILKLEDHPFSKTGKLLLFSIEFISVTLKKLFPQAQITNAERRILLQSLSGVTLKKAAEVDNVSYETKKSQLKSVFQKTLLNKQQALSNFLITHLTLEIASKISRKPDNAESDEMFFHYVDTYMGSYVRASVIQESAKHRFRVIELGDPAGMPVVCIHHLGIINFSEKEIDYIHKNRIRLICPLRHGALGPADSKISAELYFEHAISGIDLAVSLTGQSNATVLSLLSGCMYAINYIEKHPEKVGKLIMLGASYKSPVESNITSMFKKNLHDLATKHEGTLELTVSTMLDSIDQPQRLKKVVQQSNSNSDADNQTIEELFSDKNQVKAMQHRLRNSPLSIVQDLKTQAAKDWSPFQRIKQETEIHFIHGSEDRLIPVENIKNLIIHRPTVKLHIVEGAGNWIFGKYTNQTSSIIRGIIENTLG